MKWTHEKARDIYNLPFNELIAYANKIYSQHFDVNQVQVSTLLNIKKGGCSENCSYCSQSAHFKSGRENKEPLMDVELVIESAKKAKASGASRFCMAAAWRGPKEKDMATLTEMVRQVKSMGLETCLSAGLLEEGQAERFKEAGLDFYNHNIDTSEEYYDKIITTRKFADRVKTLSYVADAGINTCCGGILGLGEKVEDRVSMLVMLANLDPYPKSVPINMLVAIPGTPLGGNKRIDVFDFVRTIALARIMMPKAFVRLSAGRTEMSDEMQALCFFVGANSIFYGEELLTTPNPVPETDRKLFERLGIEAI